MHTYEVAAGVVKCSQLYSHFPTLGVHVKTQITISTHISVDYHNEDEKCEKNVHKTVYIISQLTFFWHTLLFSRHM